MSGSGLRRLMWAGCLCLGMLGMLAGCSPVNAIGVSNDTLAFDRNERPMFLDVWNSNEEIETLLIEAHPADSWVVVEPPQVSSQAPLPGAAFDKMAMQVSIDRSRLTAGKHESILRLQAAGVKSVNIRITVTQDTDGTGDGLSLKNVQAQYSTPYLIEYSFGVHDEKDLPVILSPDQFQINAWEDGDPVNTVASGIRLRSMAARQLRVEMLLDYSAAMQQQNGAIAAMEKAAVEQFLPALAPDVLVSAAEFHRDDRDASAVAVPSTDRSYTTAAITAIQQNQVQGFQSGARLIDAVADSLNRLESVATAEERCYMVIFADGRDTSSSQTLNDLLKEAEEAGIVIYAVTFGDTATSSILEELTAHTGGALYRAEKVTELTDAFTRIAEELDGQYTLRWATLRRDNRLFYPSFSIGANGHTVTYAGQRAYDGAQFAGDVLKGRLQWVRSESADTTVMYLRTDYIPRNITRLRLWIHTETPLTEAVAEGLTAAWPLSITEVSGGYQLDLEKADSPLPFAGIGPILRISFPAVIENPISETQIDNSIYPGGQYFVVESATQE